MKISDWLDEKVAEQVDVSQIDLPADMLYDEDSDEMVFSKSLILAGFSARKIIPSPLSNVLGTGTTAEVKTGTPAFIHRK